MVLDRFEGGFAVIQTDDDGLVFRIPAFLVPSGAKEGDVLLIAVSVDADATKKAKRDSEGLLEGFFDA